VGYVKGACPRRLGLRGEGEEDTKNDRGISLTRAGSVVHVGDCFFCAFEGSTVVDAMAGLHES
jgi:hypothetical protein